jgi:hypothetical protein
MKKDVYYFPHYSNARNDTKIMKLRRVLGLEGYAIYFMLLETLREQGDFKLPVNIITELEFEYRVSKEKILSVINDFELFTLDNDVFYSVQQVAYLQPYLEKTERARLAAKTRWDRAKAMQMQSKSIANEYTIKESKRNKRNKVNKEKVKITLPFNTEKFNHKWNLWKQYKKEQFNFTYKSIISEQATMMQLCNLADGLETEAIEIIMYSIAQGYKGLYKEDKKRNNGTHQDQTVTAVSNLIAKLDKDS